MLIGIDVHKRWVNITEMEEDGTVRENYEIENSEESWNKFTERYLSMKPEIALEQSTSGKYVARLLRDRGFSVHIADPVKLALIYNSTKKSDKEDSYKLAKLLRLGELPEVHLPSEYSDDLKSLVRYRKSLGEEVTMIKNRVHALLTMHGIIVDATDIFGRKGMREMEESFPKLKENEKIVMEDMLKRLADLFDRERSSFHRHIRDVMDTIEKTEPDERGPARIRAICGEYCKYIKTTVKEGKYYVQARNNAISQRENRMGRFMLVYSGEYSPIECLDLYRDKDRVEKAFEILKSDLDIFPLRERKPSTIRGLIFILFISLIVRLSLRRMMTKSGLNRRYSMDKMFLELEKLQMMEIDGKMMERERTKKQRDILDALPSVTCT